MSCSVRLGLPPFGGITEVALPGSPGWCVRPLVMMLIRKLGSSGSATPGRVTIGFRAGPMPPPRLAPWQVAQFCPNRTAQLLGSPGRADAAGLPEGAGVGELAARVVIAVSANSAGMASATSAESLRPCGSRMARRIIAVSILGPRRE